MKLRLTKRISTELRPCLRARATPVIMANYDALHAIAAAIDKGDDAGRGGAHGETRIDMTFWPRGRIALLRDILSDTLTACSQVQVRAAIQRRIDRLDDFLGTSAVERLARLS